MVYGSWLMESAAKVVQPSRLHRPKGRAHPQSPLGSVIRGRSQFEGKTGLSPTNLERPRMEPNEFPPVGEARLSAAGRPQIAERIRPNAMNAKVQRRNPPQADAKNQRYPLCILAS